MDHAEAGRRGLRTCQAVAELLAGAEPKLPPTAITFKAAEKVKAEGAKQEGLFGADH
jgi:hypothetical protein